MVAKGFDSIVDPRYVSFLSRDQELSIPAKPVHLQQNKKLVSIWLEAKEQLNAELNAQAHFTTEEIEESAEIDKVRIFFKNTLRILERWMKTMCTEEGDIVSALVVDQLIKSVMIKLDSVFTVKEAIVQAELEDCQVKLHDLKEACKNKLQEQLTCFDIERKQYKELIEAQKQKLTSQHGIVDQLQGNVNTEQEKVKELTSHNERLGYLTDLQENFRSINSMINDNEKQKKRSVMLLAEYTRMIDIGVTKVPRFEQALQTEISLIQNRPPAVANVMDTKSTAEIMKRLYDPIEALSFGELS